MDISGRLARRSLLSAAAVGLPGLVAAGYARQVFAASDTGGGGGAGSVGSEADRAAASAHARMAADAPEGMRMEGNEQVNMLVYPGFTALDLVGPQFALAMMMGATVNLVSTSDDLSPVESDTKVAIVPHTTMRDAVAKPAVLFVPGGSMGTVLAMENAKVREFVAAQAAQATWVTSVCTGSMVLAAAGVLRGRRATSHWAARAGLADFGATPVNERVVIDGNVITGAGVTAGLDMAFTLVAHLRGKGYAQAAMLQAEYAPQPPFPGGTLERTPPEVAGPMQAMMAPLGERMRAVAKTLGG